MGAGAGISFPGMFRLATDRTVCPLLLEILLYDIVTSLCVVYTYQYFYEMSLHEAPIIMFGFNDM